MTSEVEKYYVMKKTRINTAILQVSILVRVR